MQDQQIETVKVPCTIIEEDGSRTKATILAQLGPAQKPGPDDTVLDEGQRLLVHRRDLV